MDHQPGLKTSLIIKRSIVLHGHKTSVSLENEFWNALHKIAEREQTTVSDLVGRIEHGSATDNLSSAIRVFVLNHYRAKLKHP